MALSVTKSVDIGISSLYNISSYPTHNLRQSIFTFDKHFS